MNNPEIDRKCFRAINSAYDIVAMAASAGGLTVLTTILSQLPKNFPAAILIVQHLDPHHPSLLVQILSKRIDLSIRQAKDNDCLEAATVFVAPPDLHLIVKNKSRLALTQTELVKFVRPSADLLFQSVALEFPGRAIGVVLTGNGSDGSLGLLAIKHSGGVAIAQDKATSQFFGMPDAAIRTGAVDYILPLDEISGKLVELVSAGERI